MPSTCTVSRWPQSSSVRPPPLPRARTITLGRPGVASSSSDSSPCSRAHPATYVAISCSPAPPSTSDGLTESMATSSEVSAVMSLSMRASSLMSERYGLKLADSLAPLEHIFITEVEPAAPGTRLAVKDLFDTARIQTTYGSAVFRDHVPTETAGAVALLEGAGYVNAGKANLHEFAWGITSENEHYGWVPNPAAPGRIAGGSSGGCAAALAAGLVETAIGTDSGGSIRIPSACCGTTGFKPTFALVPLDGCFPLAPSYDHAGPMARDVASCERMMEALAPEFAATEVDLADLTVGVAWTELAEPLVRARVEAAAALLPNVRPLDVPLAPAAAYPVFQREA